MSEQQQSQPEQPRYPELVVSFAVHSALPILVQVRETLRAAGLSESIVAAFTDDVLSIPDYGHILDKVRRWVTVR